MTYSDKGPRRRKLSFFGDGLSAIPQQDIRIKSNRMAVRVMEESIITGDEEPDYRMIGKMLDNKTINNRITTARLRYWGHIR
jgi:hypothetical protein